MGGGVYVFCRVCDIYLLCVIMCVRARLSRVWASGVLSEVVWCVVVCCEGVLFIYCVFRLFVVERAHFLAHPLTTLLCLAALFVDVGLAACRESG